MLKTYLMFQKNYKNTPKVNVSILNRIGFKPFAVGVILYGKQNL